ncbi:hypothetical protein TWF679_008101 [Orbilia oligospora]|uniref:F-box domain-containing protein n=1 Tax=Orbilia oligospora TaxID=2813651 RepID=A0A8H8VKM9_ORBOL|nr:hypothetical protein TWF679_008101 [Orbilia oligospora]
MASSSPQLPPLLRLPPELQLEILIFLPRFDQIIATQVCTTFRHLLSTRLITQTHYTAVSLSGRRSVPDPSTSSSPSPETLHSAFPRTHFLLEESTSGDNGVLIFTARGGKVENYIYIHGDEHTEQEGELWDEDVGGLDSEIKLALIKEKDSTAINPKTNVDGGIESTESTISTSTLVDQKDQITGPGDPLDIDYEGWDSPTVVFFAENEFVTRFTGGRDLTHSSSLDQPFICPFTTVPAVPDENEEMKFKFELDLYKDELLEGPKAPYTKKWEEGLAFKRDASVRDWITKLIEKIYVQAVEEGVTLEEKVWATVQVARLRSQDAWIITTVLLRVSVEARKEMIWVRRKNGHFLLIKKKMWDKRAGWDLNSKKEGGNEDKGGKAKDEEEGRRISYC